MNTEFRSLQTVTSMSIPLTFKPFPVHTGLLKFETFGSVPTSVTAERPSIFPSTLTPGTGTFLKFPEFSFPTPSLLVTSGTFNTYVLTTASVTTVFGVVFRTRG